MYVRNVEMEKHFAGSLESQVNMQELEEKERCNTSDARSVRTLGLKPPNVQTSSFY